MLVVLATARPSAGKKTELERALRDRHLQAPHIATLMQRFDGVPAAPPEIAEMGPLS